MDALALLCTLHADGPATWRRLRDHGCQSLPELARFEPAELSEIIGGTIASAKRFLREARHLGERSGSGWLEREEPVVAAPVALATSPVPAPAPAPAPELTEQALLPVRDQEILDNVLRAWREEDTKQFAQELSEPQPTPEPAPLAEAGGHALEPNLVDGLSELVCERLHLEDVHTLEQLLEADLGQLALRSGLGYSRLYRLRSLGERFLRSAPVEEPVERVSPAEIPSPAVPRDLLQIPTRGFELPRRTPRWSPLEEGAAGPFA